MRKCPNCGSTSIKEEIDRSKIIGYLLHDPIYEKTLVCKNCTHRWKSGEEAQKPARPSPEEPEPPLEEPESLIEESKPLPEEPEAPPEEPEAPPEEPPT
ncbi:hypothetical protein [Candidatus Borrarchaeum sp.]|uniref:hypothetical protein n=1 Tax=Candidatus Borrarchaeum sp. TaxID=2846742 RepID=UPI00257BA66E|nr:hypothetical protein [Candidatus Borrarchaeum sp.]